MSAKRESILVSGRSLGIAILVAAQLLIGVIHVLFGFLLLASENSFLHATEAYDFYTIAFGMLTMVFAVLFWQAKKAGWVGTVAVSVFVSAADALVLLGLPSIPGIPIFAAPTEIGYSILVIAYLSSAQSRRKFLG